MGFLETIESARAFLERNGRVSLRALRREFGLDAGALRELVEELVDVQQVARPVPLWRMDADARWEAELA